MSGPLVQLGARMFALPPTLAPAYEAGLGALVSFTTRTAVPEMRTPTASPPTTEVMQAPCPATLLSVGKVIQPSTPRVNEEAEHSVFRVAPGRRVAPTVVATDRVVGATFR